MGLRGCAWGAMLGALLLAGGCASVTHGTTQSVRVDTVTASGEAVADAECQMTNDKGSALTRSGQPALVRRSGGNLIIQCTAEGQAPASGQATSRVNAGMVGNIMVGGIIGAAIDSGTGAGYNYPTWMRLVFGEVRDYDRNRQVGDEVLAGLKTGETRRAALATAPVPEPTGTPPAAPAVAAATPVIAPAPMAPSAAPTTTAAPAAPAAGIAVASAAPAAPVTAAPTPPPPTPAAAAPTLAAPTPANPFATTRIEDLRQLLPVNR